MAAAAAAKGDMSALAAYMGSVSNTMPDPVALFLEANNLDVAAGNALRALAPALRMDVIAEGTIKGRNPSAILMARIRKVQSWH